MKADSKKVSIPFQPIEISFVIESQEEYDTLLKMANLPTASLKQTIAKNSSGVTFISNEALYNFLTLLHTRLLTTNK